MIVLNAYSHFKPARIDEALRACETVRKASIEEPGCERYDFFPSARVPGLVVFVEEWTSKEHLDTHFQQEAFQTFFATVGPMLEREPEIRIFEATMAE